MLVGVAMTLVALGIGALARQAVEAVLCATFGCTPTATPEDFRPDVEVQLRAEPATGPGDLTLRHRSPNDEPLRLDEGAFVVHHPDGSTSTCWSSVPDDGPTTSTWQETYVNCGPTTGPGRYELTYRGMAVDGLTIG